MHPYIHSYIWFIHSYIWFIHSYIHSFIYIYIILYPYLCIIHTLYTYIIRDGMDCCMETLADLIWPNPKSARGLPGYQLHFRFGKRKSGRAPVENHWAKQTTATRHSNGATVTRCDKQLLPWTVWEYDMWVICGIVGFWCFYEHWSQRLRMTALYSTFDASS